MGGLFGVVSENDCIGDLFYGTDYHCHLGTQRGGMVVKNETGYTRVIHDITNAQFRSKFEDDLKNMHGKLGIGVISDYEDQPLLIQSHLGVYTLVTVGKIANAEKIAAEAFTDRATHFSEITGAEVNPTELVAMLINRENSFENGIRYAQHAIDGSCSLLLLTDDGIYAARDRLGRTPIVIGKKSGKEKAWAATMESCALPNLDYEIKRYLGPGEIVCLTPEGIETCKEPGEDMQICSFFWVYYGYPASTYEGINTEAVRNRCGAALARRDNLELEIVAGIPDSGSGHAIGYANESKLPYRRPFVKYTPTWPRSFMPQDQRIRDLVAKMKLIPVNELIQGNRLLFCEDSIVRGTQLRNTIQRIFASGAREIHMRAACPPLMYGCKFLNFSRSKSVMDLAARKAIKEIEGDAEKNLELYTDPATEQYAQMVERIRVWLGVTTLKYQLLDDLIASIGLPAEKLCTYCWTGKEHCPSCVGQERLIK
ncbi:MAG: amidophosphoribosyltransferase [Planctomycetes bacterium]|nr:amidophosphoribosyltransferase [Planctomycetota bacterium]